MGRAVSLGAFAVAVTGWLVWIVCLPVLLETTPVPRPLAIAAAFTYRLGGIVCHQDPARSFVSGGVQVPVCARCTGLYTGAVVGAGAALLWALRRRRWPSSLGVVRLILIGCALPTACLWLAEWLLGLPVGNAVRWAAAVPLGAAVAWAIGLAIAGRLLMTDTRPASGVH